MLKGALLPTVIVGAAGIALFSILKGLHGFYGAMVAQVVVVIFFLVHLLISKLSRNLDPMATMALAMFSYFAKVMVMGAFLLVLTKFTSRDVIDRTSFGVTAIVLTVVGLLSALLSFGSEPWQPTIDSFGPVLAGWVVASAVIGSAARFLIQTYAQSLSAHSHGVVIMVVEPVWTALLSAAWFGETMTGMQLAGCGLIFAALLISRAAAVGQLVRSALRQDVPS